MPEKTPRDPQPAPHDLILESRARLTVTGVQKVLHCNADSAAMETGKGTLHLTGAQLNMAALDLETGEAKFTGRIDAREEEAPKLLLNEAQPLTESAVESLQQPKKGTQKSVYTDAQAAKLAPQKLFLRISSLQSDEWTQIKEVLRTQPGDTPVYLYPMDTKKKTLAARRYWCKPDIAFLTKLRFLLREEDVIIQ